MDIVEVIRPNPGENAWLLGWSKLTKLNMLKNSARNWSRMFSRIEVVLKIEKAMSLNPGPLNTPRPNVPGRFTAAQKN